MTTKSAPSMARSRSSVVTRSPGPAVPAQDPAGQPADRLQPVGVGVEQDQFVDHQPVLVSAQAVDQLRRVGAPASRPRPLWSPRIERNITWWPYESE